MCHIYKVTGNLKDEAQGEWTYFFSSLEMAEKFYNGLVERGYPNLKIWMGNEVTHDWDIVK